MSQGDKRFMSQGDKRFMSQGDIPLCSGGGGHPHFTMVFLRFTHNDTVFSTHPSLPPLA